MWNYGVLKCLVSNALKTLNITIYIYKHLNTTVKYFILKYNNKKDNL